MSPPATDSALTVPRAGANEALQSISRGTFSAAVPYLFVLAILLASFPARNDDLWAHLAAGRDSLTGRLGPTWAFDAVSYLVFAAVGGAGLVALKAATAAAAALLLARTARTGSDWLVPCACAGLAALAMSPRLLVQPATASYLLFVAVVWLLARDRREPASRPGWALVAVALIWANAGPWVEVGVITTALVWVGRRLDRDNNRPAIRIATSVAVLVAVAALNPGYWFPSTPLHGVESNSFVDLHNGSSPFARVYLSAARESPALLAYYLLLGAGLGSFALAPRTNRWERLLPWFALAALSALQARAVPFFAAVGGPVLAWNLQDFLAARRAIAPESLPRYRLVTRTGIAVIGAAFLICAWPGWLQGPPFEPRRWAVEISPSLEEGATAAARWQASADLPPGTTIHLSPPTASAFAWFCPEMPGVVDPGLVEGMIRDDSTIRDRAGAVGRVVAFVGDRSSLAVLEQLLADPDRWPLLQIDGGVAAFGHRSGEANPYRGMTFDLNRVGFHPKDGVVAPASPPDRRLPARRWWDAFWRSFPPRPAARDEATLLLMLNDTTARSGGRRLVIHWESAIACGLIASAADWTGPWAAADAGTRLTVMRPPQPAAGETGQSPLAELTVAGFERFAAADAGPPPAALYAAIRAARRAVAANPQDANTYLNLGRAYLLLEAREQSLTRQFPQLTRLRQVQASVSLNRAVALDPNLAQAHLLLGMLYPQLGCADLAVAHLKAFRAALARRGSVAGTERLPAGATDAELKALSAALDQQLKEFAEESARSRVADRAEMALGRGLGGTARDLLTESDIAAFGPQGAKLELDLLLRTGRAADVLDWATPEFRDVLGADEYHWLKVQALTAIGDYAGADAELAGMIGKDGKPAAPAMVATVLSRLIGAAVLDEIAYAPTAASAPWRAVRKSDFQAGAGRIGVMLRQQSDAAALRGLIAMEAGDGELATRSLRDALAYSGEWPFGRALGFSGEAAADAALGWLTAAE